MLLTGRKSLQQTSYYEETSDHSLARGLAAALRSTWMHFTQGRISGAALVQVQKSWPPYAFFAYTWETAAALIRLDHREVCCGFVLRF